jgi:hypothetical protein
MALCAEVDENEKGRRPGSQDETVWRARRLKASYALWPKALRRNDGSPRIPRGCLKFGKSGWDSYAKGPILFRFPKVPPGLRWDPFIAYVRRC